MLALALTSSLGCLPANFDDLSAAARDAAMSSSDADTSHDAAVPAMGCASPTPECTPATPAQTRSVDCTDCGAKMQSRSCLAATCTWDAWQDTSACTWCEKCARVVYCMTPADKAANRGTWCVQEACSREQALGDCLEDVKAKCGSPTEPFYMEYL